MNKTNADSGKRCSLIILSIAISFILSIVVAGLCVRFLTEGKVQQVILITLICILATVGTIGVIILEVRRRKVIKVKRAKGGNYKVAPSAPPLSDSSWKFSKNYSQRTTIQA